MISWRIIWKVNFLLQDGFKSKTPAIARVFKIHQNNKNAAFKFKL
jgi:hypothetical protein